ATAGCRSHSNRGPVDSYDAARPRLMRGNPRQRLPLGQRAPVLPPELSVRTKQQEPRNKKQGLGPSSGLHRWFMRTRRGASSLGSCFLVLVAYQRPGSRQYDRSKDQLHEVAGDEGIEAKLQRARKRDVELVLEPEDAGHIEDGVAEEHRDLDPGAPVPPALR